MPPTVTVFALLCRLAAAGFVIAAVLLLLATPFAAVTAQPREKVPRVGYLNPAPLLTR